MFEYNADFLVLTGSLPRGVPNDFYARATQAAKAKGVRVILDTSGRALFECLKTGVYVVKPSLRELEHLVGQKASTHEDQETICRKIVGDGQAEIVALTLGADGALMVSKNETVRLAPPDVDVKSAVGAGDSFVAGLTMGLASGMSESDAFRLAVATGSASVMNAGAKLAQRPDIDRLFKEIADKPLKFETN
jgi:6-phosphofructokinase 2